MLAPKQFVYLIQPLDGLSPAIQAMVDRATADAGAELGVIDAYTSNVTALHSSKTLERASLIIADVTGSIPNVMFEIGRAEALQKPIIYIASSIENVPLNLGQNRIYIYERDHPEELIGRLAKQIKKALASPTAFVTGSAEDETTKRHKVFVSYCHKDRDYLDRLLVHLKPLERDGLIELWVDTKLRPGDKWKREIEKALARSTVAVLLVSSDFLASDFITENELPPLLQDAQEKGTRIIPLIVKPCRFTRDKNLRHFQAMNDPARSLILLPFGEQELLYDSLAAEIERHQPKFT